jgi:hypothetical protein
MAGSRRGFLWLFGVLLLSSTSSLAIGFVQFAATGVGAPVVTGATVNISTPVTNGGAVVTVSATNSPTSWSITGGDPSGNYQISNSGIITTTATGVTNLVGDLVAQTLIVQATNANGSGSHQVTVNAWGDGFVNAPSGTAQYSAMLNGAIVGPPNSQNQTITSVTGAANNGSGIVRLSVTSTAAMVSNQVVYVSGVGGTTNANIGCQITVIDATHIDLINVPFNAAYTSGGTVSSYIRPPWKVAGIDYAVGPNPGVTLKDPATISVSGVSVVGSTVTVSGNNVSLDGYDFTTAPGYHILVTGSNFTLTNFLLSYSSYSGVSPASPPIKASGSGTGCTLKYGTVDGGQGSGSNMSPPTCVDDATAGVMTLQYMWLKNCDQHPLECNGHNVRFCLLDSNMYGGSPTPHGDHIYYAGAFAVTDASAKFNFFFQAAADVGTGLPGGVVAAHNASGFGNNSSFSGCNWSYNCGIGLGSLNHSSGPTAMETWINWTNAQGGTAHNNNPVATDNYVNMSGVRSGFKFEYPFDTTVVNPTLARNWDMEKGAAAPT